MQQITLKAARVMRGFKLKEVARITKKHPETIAKYESDSTNIPRILMEQLLDLYKISGEYIFFGPESVYYGQGKNTETL